jgi:hypothetical protein
LKPIGRAINHRPRRLGAELDEAELEVTHGQRERLIDKVRDKYSYSQEEAEQEVDTWAEGLQPQATR